MLVIDNLKQQNDDICDLIFVLSILIHDDTARDSRTVFKLLRRLAKEVDAHFALEDKSLYTQFLNHEDKQIEESAWRFLSGEKQIKRFVSNYTRKWCHRFSAVDRNDKFLHETEELFRVLLERIKSMDEEFYPLVDKLITEQHGSVSTH